MSALPQEIAALRSSMSGLESIEVRGRQFHRGVIDTHNVVLATVGIGDVVVGERVDPHDTGVLRSGGLDRYQSGHVAFLNPTD